MSRYSHHKYVWSKPFSSVRHNWELVGPYGAIHFHVSMTPSYDPSCGLEYHHTEAGVARVGGHFIGTAPHHINCPLTGGRCWHDGTSMYASETVWPFVESYLRVGDHEAIFRFLEGEADRHFRHRDEPDEEAEVEAA